MNRVEVGVQMSAEILVYDPSRLSSRTDYSDNKGLGNDSLGFKSRKNRANWKWFSEKKETSIAVIHPKITLEAYYLDQGYEGSLLIDGGVFEVTEEQFETRVEAQRAAELLLVWFYDGIFDYVNSLRAIRKRRK